MEALLDSGSLTGDFIAKRVVSQLKLEHHVVSNKSRTVCSGLDISVMILVIVLPCMFFISMNF